MTFSITPVDDEIAENPETLTVSLMLNGNDYSLGTPAGDTVSIFDDDGLSGDFALTAVPLSSEELGFSWTHAASADQYRIEISRDGTDFFGSSLIEPGETSYEFGGFDPGETFVFRAVALSSGTDVATSNLVAVTLPQLGSASAASAPPAAPASTLTRFIVGFNGYYLNDPMESHGNQWFERIIRDMGETTRAPLPASGQQSYNFDDRNIALGDLLIITQQEASEARIVVMGYSLGGVEAANFAVMLEETGNIQAAGSDSVLRGYLVQAPIQVDVLATLDPVTGGGAIFRKILRLPKGRISGNVQQFVNYYQTDRGFTSFGLHKGGATNNGANFGLWPVIHTVEPSTLVSATMQGVKLEHSLAANRVKQLNINDAAQVGPGRYSSNVTYWFDVPDPISVVSFDADLTASGVEHIILPWYVRGGAGGGYDAQINILNDAASV